MARPIKQKVDYFPHDASASEGRTISILYNNFGHEGISCWWQLLERISATNNHVINLRNGEDTEYLAAKLHFKPERLTEILNKLADLEAIDPKLWQSKTIWIQNLVDRLSEVYSKRRQPLPSRPELLPPETRLSTPETELSAPETPQIKLNKIKLYNIIYTVWNNEKIIVHEKLTDKMKAAINTALKDYSEPQITQAIKNYAIIQKGEEFFFKYKWGLADFLHRGVERFLDLSIAQSNYRKGGQNGTYKGNLGQKPGVKTVPKPEDYPDPDKW